MSSLKCMELNCCFVDFGDEMDLEACQEFRGCLRFKDFLKLMRLILDFQDLISR